MKHHIFLIALAATAALAVPGTAPAQPPILQQLEDGFVQLHDQLRPSVVNIDVKGKDQGMEMGQMEELYRFFNLPMPSPEDRRRMPSRPRGTGSGFIYDPEGYIITNNHVVENADEITVRLSNGKEYEAVVSGTDPETDLAVIKIEADEPLRAIPLGDSDALKVGEFAIAIGSPRGLEGSMSVGHISALGREGLAELAAQGLTFQNLIQTDAAINLGNSGGPLCNIRGEVIGINTAIILGANSIGFAIPINTAKEAVTMLISKGKVSRGYLGVSIDDAKNYADVDSLGLPDSDGAVVRQVQPGTPADTAGIKTYDVVRKVNGEPVKTASELVRRISSFSPGTKVVLEVWRDKAPTDVEITLTERNVADGGAAPDKDVLGVRVQELTPQLLERMGMDAALRGVVVTDVEPGSPAEEARLMQGDVITEVGQQSVTSPAEFRSTLEKHAVPGKSVLVRFVRGNNDPDITVIRVPKD